MRMRFVRLTCRKRGSGHGLRFNAVRARIGSKLEGIAPPTRVSLAFKHLEDGMIEMMARFLDETSTRYGDQIKAWRDEG